MSRDVLAPPLLRMGTNRCYRVNLIHEDFGGNSLQQQLKQQESPAKQQQGYMEQDLYAEDDDDEDEVGAYEIEEVAHAVFKLTMHVSQAFYGGLIGFKGSTKRRIETETKTEIFVPRSSTNKSNKVETVSIKGKTRTSVCTARRQIILLIASLRKRMRPTHFLCVALNKGEIRERYIEFKNKILAANLAGIDEQLFQNDGCIHLTLGTCILLDDAERAQAVELLNSCRKYLTNLKFPFNIKIAGLEIMNDDPSAVRVLYARVEAPELQKFADLVLTPFLQKGLAFNEHERDNVKLHMTALNNRYRKQMNAQASDTFDAREILKQFGDYNFGTAECSEVQLCVIRAPSDAREFYKVTGVLKF